MSKKFFIQYILFISLLISLVDSFAGADEELFLQAQKLYQQEKFQDALLIYRSLSKKSAAVWENRGNAAFYLQEYPEAIASWRQAQTNAERKKYRRLQERINQALQKLHREQHIPWYERTTLFFVGYMNYLPLFFWQSIFLFCWIVLIFCSQWFFARRRRLLWLLLLSITSIVALGLAALYWQKQKRIGIIMHDGALHTGMNTQFPISAYVKPGQQVSVISEDSEWYCVYDGQHRGWIEKNKLAYNEQ